MAPYESSIRCRCNRNALEWVSLTEKNPGRRFVKCANGGCRFWEWLEEPISPLVRSVMDDNLKKSQRRVKMLFTTLLCCFVLIFYLVKNGNGDSCKCWLQCGCWWNPLDCVGESCNRSVLNEVSFCNFLPFRYFSAIILIITHWTFTQRQDKKRRDHIGAWTRQARAKKRTKIPCKSRPQQKTVAKL